MSGAGIMEPDQAKSKMKKVKEVIDPALRIPGRLALPSDPAQPKPVIATRKMAAEAGWDVETIYARGITDTPKLIHIYGLRMTRATQSVTAIWNADARAAKLEWKFTYAGTLGGFITGNDNTLKRFPFTISSDEMKGLLKAQPTTRILMLDSQYEIVASEDKVERFIPHSEFQAPYKRAPRPKKEEAAKCLNT